MSGEEITRENLDEEEEGGRRESDVRERRGREKGSVFFLGGGEGGK